MSHEVGLGASASRPGARASHQDPKGLDHPASPPRARKVIELDLRRDLPKIIRNQKTLISHLGLCRYSTPCAIGVMMSAAERRRLASKDTISIGQLIDDGIVCAPVEQHADLRCLQRTFDDGFAGKFNDLVARLASIYLAETVDA